jgi:hypothetical protein
MLSVFAFSQLPAVLGISAADVFHRKGMDMWMHMPFEQRTSCFMLSVAAGPECATLYDVLIVGIAAVVFRFTASSMAAADPHAFQI